MGYLYLKLIGCRKYHFKRSRAEQIMNYFLFFQILFMFMLIIWMGFMEYWFSSNHLFLTYIYYGVDDYYLLAFKASLSYFLLFN